MLTRYRKDFLALVILLILPLALYWDVTVGGKTMLPADNLFQWEPWATYADQFDATVPHNSLLSDLILQNYPWKQFVRESIANREIPLWSPELFAGAPFLAKGQASVLYPFSILFYILPLSAAYGWFTLSQLWLAGVSMFVFSRILKLRPNAALIAGIVYQGSGFMLVSSAVFPMILAAAVWLPLLLGCIDMIVRINRSSRGAGKTLPWVALGAAALGCQLLAGHPEITYYTLLIMALFALWRLITVKANNGSFVSHYVKPSAWLAGFVAVGLLLGAVQFVPLFEVGQTNFRDDSASYQEVIDWAFPKRRVLTLALPNFFGNPAHHTYRDVLTGDVEPFATNYYGNPNPHGAFSSNWGIKNYVEGGIYLGILPLILAAIGVWRTVRPQGSLPPHRRAHAGFFVGLAIFSLGCIFGTPLYALLYYGLPFIDQLHSPFRWVFALSLAVATLAGFGMDALQDDKTPSRGLSRLLMVGGAAGFAGLWVSRLIYGQLEPIVERVLTGLAQAADAFPSAQAFYSYLFPQLFTFATLLLLSGVWLTTRKQLNSRWILLPALLIIADLFLANRGFHAAVDPALLDFKPELVQWFDAQPGQWRLTTLEAHGDKPFNANSGWLFGFEDVRGYDSIIAKSYTEYMASIDTQNELDFNRVAPLHNPEAVNSPLLDLLNVKYIITPETLDAYPKLTRVWEGEGLRVYENLAVMPRAYTLPFNSAVYVDDALAEMVQRDPRQWVIIEGDNPVYAQAVPNPQAAAATPATITAYSNVEVWVDVSLDEAGWVVLADSYASGWRAFVRPQGGDERSESPYTIEQVNGNFRAIYIEEGGDYTVRFRYSPRTFIIGALASFMGGILVIFGFGVWGWRQFYRQKGELTNTQSIAKNSVVPMAMNLFNKGIDFAFAMFYLRVLGPGESGAYATAITIALWFDIVANWGLDALIIRDVAPQKDRAGHYLFNTSVLRLATMVVGIVPVMLFVGEGFLSGNPLTGDILIALGLIAVGMVFSGLSKGVTGLFYVFESAEYPAALTTVSTILKVVLGVMVLLFGWGFIGLAGVSIVVNVVTLGLLTYTALRQFPLTLSWQLDWQLQRAAFKTGWPLMLNHLLATVFFKIDQPLLYRFDGQEAVGWYNSAYKWVDAFNIIPSFFTFALFPIISRQVQSSLADARRTFRMSVKILVLIALPLAAVVTLLADIMIGALGGQEFLPDGAIALRLVIWSIPIGWINSVTNYMIISLGLERRLTLGFIIGVAFNTLGNILLIPRFGYIAAGTTTILSELILLAIFNMYLRQRIDGVRWVALLWRPLTVTLAMLGAMWLGLQLHWGGGSRRGLSSVSGWFVGVEGIWGR